MSLDAWVVKRKKVGESSSTPQEPRDLPEVDDGPQPPKAKVKKISGILPISENKYQKWLKEFRWLEVSEDRKKLLCRACRDASMKNSFASEGASNAQHSTLLKHSRTQAHITALSAKDSRKFMQKTFDKSTAEVKQNANKVFRTIYYMAKNDVPGIQINNLLELQKENGVDLKSCTMHHDTRAEIETVMSDIIKEELMIKLQDCSFFSIMLDETTDLSVTEKLVLYIQFVNKDTCKAETHFLKNVIVKDGKAATIVEAVKKCLTEFGLDITKLVGVGSDGASVMIGQHSGVCARLRKDIPRLINIHCSAHRLHLAVSQAAREVPYLMKYKDTIASVYTFYSRSALRQSKLREIQSMLHEGELTLKQVYEVRWLSLHNSVRAISNNFASLVTSLESEASEGGDATAHGLVKFMKTKTFVQATALLLDSLADVTRLSTFFQKETLDIASIGPMVDATVKNLESQISENGTHLQEVQDILDGDGDQYKGIELNDGDNRRAATTSFNAVKDEFLTHIVANLKSRFNPEVNYVTNAFSIFNPRTLPTSVKDIEEFGDEKLEILGAFYGDKQTDDGSDGQTGKVIIDKVEIKKEWSLVRKMIYGSFSKLRSNELCTNIISEYSEEFPNIATLCNIALSIPISSVPCERGFSYQNRVKNKLRSRLKEGRLEDLMRIFTEGPPMKDFDFDNAVKVWEERKTRRKVF